MKTLRQFLIGELYDFCRPFKILNHVCSADALAHLVVLLPNYREEDRRLSPSVLMCDDISVLAKFLPGSVVQPFGVVNGGLDGIKKAVKKAAIFAIDGWSIYLEATGSDGMLNYGVFHGSVGAVAVAIEDVLFQGEPIGVEFVFARKVADGCVELVNHLAERRSLALTDAPADARYFSSDVRTLVGCITSAVDENKEVLETFLFKVVGGVLQTAHGSIIVVCSDDQLPAEFVDGVTLPSIVDFGELVRGLKSAVGDLSEGVSMLMAYKSILHGAISGDGITVFSNSGKLLGFNHFLTSANNLNVNGGARTRAFFTAASFLGKGLDCVFMQSQDGWTRIQERAHG